MDSPVLGTPRRPSRTGMPLALLWSRPLHQSLVPFRGQHGQHPFLWPPQMRKLKMGVQGAEPVFTKTPCPSIVCFRRCTLSACCSRITACRVMRRDVHLASVKHLKCPGYTHVYSHMGAKAKGSKLLSASQRETAVENCKIPAPPSLSLHHTHLTYSEGFSLLHQSCSIDHLV